MFRPVDCLAECSGTENITLNTVQDGYFIFQMYSDSLSFYRVCNRYQTKTLFTEQLNTDRCFVTPLIFGITHKANW